MPLFAFHGGRLYSCMKFRPSQGGGTASRLLSTAEPYSKLMRLEKPIGSWLLFWPGAWSIAMAAHPASPSWHLLALFGVGSVIMRGAGCTINDLWDRKIDRMVERTRDRPLAARRLTKLQALSWLGVQLLGGLAVLVQLNRLSVGLGAAALLPIVIYPLMKRITYWPQLVLGFTFNWGALLGWTAQANALNLHVMVPLYVGGICWTMVYDTIYALQDVKDDLLVGVKSTAIRFGSNVKIWLGAFATASVICFAWSGLQNNMGPLYYAGVGGTALHYAWQIVTLRPHDVRDCLRKFKSNRWLGAILFLAILSDTFYSRTTYTIASLLSPSADA